MSESETDIETPEELKARLAAEDLVRTGNQLQQIIGTTAIKVANIERRLWTKDNMRDWITKEICANCQKKRPRGTSAVGRAMAFVSEGRLLLLIIIILLILLGKSMKVDVGREVGTVIGVARIKE